MVTLCCIILNYKMTWVCLGPGWERKNKVSKHGHSTVPMLPVCLNFAVTYVCCVILSVWFKILQTPRPLRKPMQYSKISMLMLCNTLTSPSKGTTTCVLCSPCWRLLLWAKDFQVLKDKDKTQAFKEGSEDIIIIIHLLLKVHQAFS